MDKCDGSFLVRDSSNDNYILSLSFKSMGQVHHTRIEHHKGNIFVTVIYCDIALCTL